MRRRHLTAAAVLGLVILAACSPAAPTPTAPPTEAALPTTAPDTAQPTDAPTAITAAETPTEAPPENPAEAAAPDAYRADPGALVGATGSPQLVEFFTYW